MKKVKILSHPTQIATIQLEDLDFESASGANNKLEKIQIRKWRKLRSELA